jgi:glucose-1-phosphate cytidylyltransferase
MKVVLFCGGAGTRLSEYSMTVPKPLVPIGSQPLVWHLMHYYRHFGHDEFVLCLGHGADLIRKYFHERFDERVKDFWNSDDTTVEVLEGSTNGTVSLVDTGPESSIGERLLSVAEVLDGDEFFLANYSDGLTDLDLAAYLSEFSTTDAVGSFLAVHPSQSFHAAVVDDEGAVIDFRPAAEIDLRINGGFFVFRHEIFDYLRDGEDLVEAPFQRLIAERRLRAYPFDGFWACLDTYKDKLMFDALNRQERPPWMVWKS